MAKEGGTCGGRVVFCSSQPAGRICKVPSNGASLLLAVIMFGTAT